MKVLCVDDDARVVEDLSRLLTFWGYTPIVATSGAEALRIIDRPDPPRLLLLDWVMPGIDGLEVARRIRSNPDAPFVYILFLTGKSLPTDLVTALDAGADEFLSKPFDAVELKSRLQVAARILERVVAGPAKAPEISGYRFEEQIGEGAFGVVYRAIQQGTERPVAVKCLRSSLLGPAMHEQFLREVRLAAKLDHPNIARIYDFRSDGEHDYYAMELVDGPTLAKALESRPFTRRESLRFLIKLGAALGHAHARGVVHRDLKPTNILLSPVGDPKIVDFGLAKTTSSPDGIGSMLTVSGGLVGTPAFMAPEQARMENDVVGPATDVYALGVLAYRLLLGAYPYTIDRSLSGLLSDIAEGRVHPPRTVDPDLGSGAEALLMKALAKNPRERFANGEKFAAAVRNIRAGKAG